MNAAPVNLLAFDYTLTCMSQKSRAQLPRVSRRQLLQTAGKAAVIGSLGTGVATPVAADPGTQEWAFQTGDWVRSSPTVVDGTVFVGSHDDNLYAVDTETGTEEWVFETGASAVFSSPTVVAGTVFIGSSDDNLYAVDTETGTEEWAFETRDSVLSSPTVVDGTVFVGSENDRLYAVDAGVAGSSEGSRVSLETLGHHDQGSDESGDGDETEAGTTDGSDESGDGDEAEAGTTDGTDELADEIPGFGVPSAIVGLGGAGYLLKSRFDSSESEDA